MGERDNEQTIFADRATAWRFDRVDWPANNTSAVPADRSCEGAWVKPGNVEGCVVVNDFKAHRKYNVFFLGDKPAMDTGISFEGLGYSHLDSHCQQGQKCR